MKDSTPSRGSRPLIRALLVRAACWFSALTLLVLTPSLFNGGTDSFTVSALRVYLLFPMALCFAGAGLVRLSGLKFGVRLTLHALLSLGGFWLFGYLPFLIKNKSGGAQVLLMTLCSLLVYVIALVILLAVKRRGRAGRSGSQ